MSGDSWIKNYRALIRKLDAAEKKKEAGLKRQTIDKMIHCLHNAFDTMGVEEAEEFWRKF